MGGLPASLRSLCCPGACVHGSRRSPGNGAAVQPPLRAAGSSGVRIWRQLLPFLQWPPGPQLAGPPRDREPGNLLEGCPRQQEQGGLTREHGSWDRRSNPSFSSKQPWGPPLPPRCPGACTGCGVLLARGRCQQCSCWRDSLGEAKAAAEVTPRRGDRQTRTGHPSSSGRLLGLPTAAARGLQESGPYAGVSRWGRGQPRGVWFSRSQRALCPHSWPGPPGRRGPLLAGGR